MASATIKDVASLAQVSIATASRVLSGKNHVEPELTKRVLDAVKTLNYRPNRLARSLRSRLTRFIALVVPDIQNPFFAAISRAVEDVAFQAGYTLLTCNTNDDPQREFSYFEVLSGEAVAGIIICTVNESKGYQEVNKVLANGIEVVAFDRRLENSPVDLVLSDNFGGARSAVSYLIELGHKRIGLITGPDRYAPARERRQGYEQAFRDHELPILPELIKITDFRDKGAEAATVELWNQPEPPTALFVGSGNSAIGVLRALNHMKLHMPDDVSLVVFDDLEWAEAYNPPVTAVVQNYAQIGSTAADLLIQKIEGKRTIAEERRIPTRLNIRDSCKPLI